MTRYIKESVAKKTRCPIARTFHEGKSANCDGSACILWRWRDIAAADPVFISAVKRAEACIATDRAEGKSGNSYHKEAVAQVGRDPEGWDVKTDIGYCGLGGKP